MTGRDLITGSLRLIGAIATGESLEASEATDGLASLNGLIQSWSTQRLLVHSVTREEFTLAPGQATRTMGSAGNFVTTRPEKIDGVGLIQSSQETPLRLLSESEWQAISDKTRSGTPEAVFISGTYPSETLNFYPVPSAANTVAIYSQKPLTEIATIDTTISLPPGYERALKYNLALELAPEYGREPSALVVNIAGESKSELKRANHRAGLLRCDSGVLPSGGGGFNFEGGR